MTSNTLQPQTDSTSPAAPRRRRLSGRAARRLAPLTAGIAILAALAGGTVSKANAAVFSDISYARLEVHCVTDRDPGGNTRHIEFTFDSPYSSVTWAQFAVSMNGGPLQYLPWRQLNEGGWTQYFGPLQNVAPGAPAVKIEVIVQFAKLIGGRFEYSPSGRFERATHYERVRNLTSWNFGYQTQPSGTSCMLY